MSDNPGGPQWSGFTMDIQGFNRVENKLRALAANMPEVCQGVIYRWAQNTRVVLKETKYPPKRVGQKYRRTGRLANSWRAVRLTNGATILNQASFKGREYARFVVGDAKGVGQAWMHKGRWWKARDIIDEQLPAMRAELKAELLKEYDKG